MIKNLQKAADRIKEAIDKKERIILYGDSDLDGIASVILLEESIKNLNGKVSVVYFPSREKDGYGLNKKALDFLSEFSPALIITVDLGISNFEEVKLAKKMGFEVVIVDHHEVLNDIPQASIVVDPKQKKDPYAFKGLAAAGIVYKLCLLLNKELIEKSDSLKNNFLELTALATIADMMPEENENVEIIREGLMALENTWRPGLRIFLSKKEFSQSASSKELAQKIISVINAGELSGHLHESYFLLTSSEKEAEGWFKKLLERRTRRQERIREITSLVEDSFLSSPESSIVFAGDPSWSLVLLGAVASRISNIYKKPTFLFRKMKTESCGTSRTPSGFSMVEALDKCSDLLKTYGGHPLAAGFRLSNENLEDFKNRLIQYFKNHE